MGNMKQPIQLVKGWVKRSLYSNYEAHKTEKLVLLVYTMFCLLSAYKETYAQEPKQW